MMSSSSSAAAAAAPAVNGGGGGKEGEMVLSKDVADFQEQDNLTRAQQEQIQADIAAAQPLVGPPEPLSVLGEEYKDNPEAGFLVGVADLGKRYAAVRRVRGDGNCFYRAFLFDYMDKLLREKDTPEGKAALADFTSKVEESKAWLVAEAGYGEMAIDTFWEVFCDELKELPSKTPQSLEALFNQEGGGAEVSYLVWYCRCLCAGFLKTHRDEFEPFLEGGFAGIEDFCAKEVEPVNRECEQIQIMALTRALGVAVKIEYLDGRAMPGKPLPHHVLPDDSLPPRVTLLYRPGHYDVLMAGGGEGS